MKQVKIFNITRPERSAIQAGYCISFTCRLRGLTFRKGLPPNTGLLLVQLRESKLDASIHMFMMFMDLAIVWINQDYTVVDVRPAYRWRSTIVPQAPAQFVLELPIEQLDDFHVGDKVRFEEVLN